MKQLVMICGLTFLLTSCNFLDNKKNWFEKKNTHQTIEDMLRENEPYNTPKVDKEYSSFLQATDLYEKYKSNRVAFNKEYNKKLIEFEGTITDITENSGCAWVKIKGSADGWQYISCGNCPENKDGWSKEVAQLQVGNTVRIKGYYSALSSEYEMSFYNCHVIP